MTAVATLDREILKAARDHDSTPLVIASAVRPHTARLGALVEDAERVAGAFQGLGVRPGDVVAVQLPNWYEGAVAQAAALLCGAVLLPLVPTYGPRELGFVLAQSGASVLVIPARWRNRDNPSEVAGLGPLPSLKAIVVVGEEAPAGMVRWDDLFGSRSRPYTPVTPDPHDVALLVYTSGTTAAPKGVQHSHTSLLAEVRSAAGAHSTGPERTQLAAFPPGHVAGLLCLLRILVLGTPTVMMDAWEAAHAARLIDEHKVTSTSGAPVHLAALLDVRERREASLASLTDYLVGAASVPPSMVERADAAGIAAYRSYGSSEHPTISTGTPLDPLSKRAWTDGAPVPGNEVRIVGDDGRDVGEGGEGEILTRGPELFVGYRDRTLDRDVFAEGGWFRSGDIGRIDPDGFLVLTDRKKDIIVRGGENISSKEVEDILVAHPRVAEAAAVGSPDERYGERVCVFVVLRSGAGLDLAEVAAHFQRSGAARHKTPERVVVVDGLPRTPAGKVQKFELRRRLRES
ncbi:AMP-binding protein [Streptomyces sp. SID4956]|uniref:AMP-binding protein n=1 Tax=Streptomyces sp. SID4956 TaxID=2690290 RepID=UPI0013707D3B|nr:AMP-binding protein [Streptomyces sp. SID4956]